MTPRQRHLLQLARSGKTILGEPKPAGFIWAIAYKYREPWQIDLHQELHELCEMGKLRFCRSIGWRDNPGGHLVYVYALPKAKGDCRPYVAGKAYDEAPRLAA